VVYLWLAAAVKKGFMHSVRFDPLKARQRAAGTDRRIWRCV
jgi:hypothetical protein